RCAKLPRLSRPALGLRLLGLRWPGLWASRWLLAARWLGPGLLLLWLRLWRPGLLLRLWRPGLSARLRAGGWPTKARRWAAKWSRRTGRGSRCGVLRGQARAAVQTKRLVSHGGLPTTLADDHACGGRRRLVA